MIERLQRLVLQNFKLNWFLQNFRGNQPYVFAILTVNQNYKLRCYFFYYLVVLRYLNCVVDVVNNAVVCLIFLHFWLIFCEFYQLLNNFFVNRLVFVFKTHAPQRFFVRIFNDISFYFELNWGEQRKSINLFFVVLNVNVKQSWQQRFNNSSLVVRNKNKFVIWLFYYFSQRALQIAWNKMHISKNNKFVLILNETVLRKILYLLYY